MKEVNHINAKKGGKITFKKVILGIIGFWILSTVISLFFVTNSKIGNQIFGLVIIGFVGFIGFKIFKTFKKLSNSDIIKSVIPKSQNKQKGAFNLSLNGNVNIENPYTGIFISGGAGAGKSKSIIEPLIADCGRKEFTGVIYDFKFPELAKYVATAYQGSEVKQYYINFTDLTRSHRINPISPEIMRNDSFAREFAFTILANLNPQMVAKPDFWTDNATSLLASTFWYLKKNHPTLCTLPHAMSMILQPDLEALLRTLSKDIKCADMIAPILTAYANKADNQLAGVVSSLQISLSKINTEEVYYITSGNDFSLDLNNLNSKGILTIGNEPTLATTYAPIIGLILTSASKLLNQQGKEKSVFMMDEFPTVFVPNVEQLPATARSNKVATILACQDIAQIVSSYGKEKSDIILSNLGNQFFGRTTNLQTAQRVSQIFGKADKLMVTESDNYERNIFRERRKGSGKSYANQERDLVKVQDVTTLNTGDFYTILSEGKTRQGLSSISIDKSFSQGEILPFKGVTDWDLEQNFLKIKKECDFILSK